MPHDLKNQEGFFPFHFDSTYDPGIGPLEGKIPGLADRAQGLAREVRGLPLSKDNLQHLESVLESKGLSYRNVGDQELETEIRSYLKRLSSSRRVIDAYARL